MSMTRARRKQAEQELIVANIHRDPSHAANWAVTWGQELLDDFLAAEARIQELEAQLRDMNDVRKA